MSVLSTFPRLEVADIRETLLRFCATGNRFVGSEGERAARELLLEEFGAAGLENVRSETFDVLGYHGEAATCEVLPSGPSLPSVGLQFTASGSVEAEAIYIGRPRTPDDIVALDSRGISIRGRIVVLNSYYPHVFISELLVREPVGVVVISDVPNGLIGNHTALLYPPPEPPEFLGRPLPLPGVTVEFEAGHQLLALMSAKRQRLRIRHQATYRPVETANVIGTLPGESDELVVIGAHYDTQLESRGYCDDGTGISALINIARSWRFVPLRRSVVFAAFGDEEHGSPGATDYCRRHRGSLARTVGMVNLDVLGWACPYAKKNLWVDPALEDFVIESAAALNWMPDVVVEFNSGAGGDCTPFLDGGVKSQEVV